MISCVSLWFLIWTDAASGSSESWAYGRAEIPYSYTLELPDLYRFNIPKERIAPTAMEILMGFK